MPPNSISEDILAERRISKTPNPEVKEVLYDGYFYDVTKFSKKHPGGSIIDYYTEHGEDATLAIQQFHQRSSKRVNGILRSFQKRKAEDHESDPSNLVLVEFAESRDFFRRVRNLARLFELDAAKLKRHRALNEDFTKLYLELEKEGMFKPSYIHNAYRFVELVLIGLIGYYCLFFESYGLIFLGSMLIGLAQGRSGWMQHESGHNSLTGIPKTDRFLHAVIFGAGLGLSSTWWARGHNRHHAMPQRLKHDVDLDTLPFMAYNAQVVKNSKQGKSFWIQNQVYLFLPIDTLLGTLAWQLYIHPKYVIKHGHYFQLLTMLSHYVLAYQIGFMPYLLSTWFMSAYLFGNFSLSHTHLPVTSEPTHWVEYSLVHTVDIAPSLLCDWWMGYLNYQIEHHLFPTMPQFRHPLVYKRVRDLAKKHNIPYISYSYFEAVQKTFSNLKNVAQELQEAH